MSVAKMIKKKGFLNIMRIGLIIGRNLKYTL